MRAAVLLQAKQNSTFEVSGVFIFISFFVGLRVSHMGVTSQQHFEVSAASGGGGSRPFIP